MARLARIALKASLAFLVLVVLVAGIFITWMGVRFAQHSWREPVERFHTGRSSKQRRPIVLVHGLNRTGRMWMVADDGHGNPIPGAKSMVDFLRANGYPNLYVNTFEDTRNTSLFEGAKVLKRWIKKAKRKYRTRDVDIVSHSMGGLIARAYIQEIDQADGEKTEPMRYRQDIARLIMIAAPHLGSPLADPFASWLGWYAPRTLREGGGPDLQRLNSISLPCGVEYHSILLSIDPVGPRRRLTPWRVVRFFLSSASPQDGDGAISLRSQNLGAAVQRDRCPNLRHVAHLVRAEPGIRHRDAPMSRAVQRAVLNILSGREVAHSAEKAPPMANRRPR